MTGKLARAGLALLAASAVIFCSAAGIWGYPGGAGSGDKVPSGCTGCHSSTGSGTVSCTPSATTIEAGAVLNMTVTVTQQQLTTSGMVGVFLLKGPAGTAQPVTADGWTILKDPDGGSHNYVERSGLAAGVPATFIWSLVAPTSTGNYSVYADVRHGGEEAVYETSPAVTVAVVPAGGGESAPPVISATSYQATAPAGSVQNISARITDDKEGVACATVNFRMPGAAGFSQKQMTLAAGTALDGTWTAGLDTGQAAGSLEFHIVASDGNRQSRSPDNGTYVMQIVAPVPPGAPQIEPPRLPDSAEINSTINITARITDGDNGVALAVVRFRQPGAAGFSAEGMSLLNGTTLDGTWVARIAAGAEPGELELYIDATDGASDTRSPGYGCYTVKIERPRGPSIDVNAPATVVIGGSPRVKATIADGLGVLGAWVRYRPQGESGWSTAPMERTGGNNTRGEWSLDLPAATRVGNMSFQVLARNPRADNQSATGTIRVVGDLYISAVALSVDDIMVKQTGEISAVIGNNGDKEVSGLSVIFLELTYPVGDMQNIRRISNITVPANGRVTLKARWVPQVEGERHISVVLDPDGVLEDGNRDNNEMGIIVQVGLESGMGQRFPVPSLGEVWVQILVAVIIGLVVARGIVSGSLRRKRIRMSAQEKDGGGVQGGGPIQGR